MSANDARKQSLYFPEDMLTEIQSQAQRLDRSLSWWCSRPGRSPRPSCGRSRRRTTCSTTTRTPSADRDRSTEGPAARGATRAPGPFFVQTRAGSRREARTPQRSDNAGTPRAPARVGPGAPGRRRRRLHRPLRMRARDSAASAPCSSTPSSITRRYQPIRPLRRPGAAASGVPRTRRSSGTACAAKRSAASRSQPARRRRCRRFLGRAGDREVFAEAAQGGPARRARRATPGSGRRSTPGSPCPARHGSGDGLGHRRRGWWRRRGRDFGGPLCERGAHSAGDGGLADLDAFDPHQGETFTATCCVCNRDFVAAGVASSAAVEQRGLQLVRHPPGTFRQAR